MKRLSTKLQNPPALAKKKGISAVTIRAWCKAGLIEGAFNVGRAWLIPNPAIITKRPTIGRPWPEKGDKNEQK